MFPVDDSLQFAHNMSYDAIVYSSCYYLGRKIMPHDLQGNIPKVSGIFAELLGQFRYVCIK